MIMMMRRGKSKLVMNYNSNRGTGMVCVWRTAGMVVLVFFCGGDDDDDDSDFTKKNCIIYAVCLDDVFSKTRWNANCTKTYCFSYTSINSLFLWNFKLRRNVIRMLTVITKITHLHLHTYFCRVCPGKEKTNK